MRAGPSLPTIRDSQLEAGLFLVVVAVPLVFAPFSTAQFVDPKAVALLAGTLLVARSSVTVDRHLALASSAWILVVAGATVFGVDPWWSLMGPENQATGLLVLGASALLLTAGTGIPETLRGRLPTWLFWTGVVVAGVAVIGRFVEFGGQGWRLGTLSSTIGHRVFVGGFLGAATLAAVTVRRRVSMYLGLVVLGSGLAVSAVRSAWIGVALALILVTLRTWPRWRPVLAVLAPIVLAVTIWTVVDRFEPQKDIAFSAAPRFAELDEKSAEQRIPVWRANLRAWQDDPMLGSGPGTGWNGYLSHATPAEIRTASRWYADAHNFPVEMLATTGAVGAIALAALGAVVISKLRGTPESQAWALGAAVTLGVVQSVQPLFITLTPLMFLCAGLAVRPATEVKRTGRLITALAAVALLLVCGRFVASSFERYGSTYASATAYEWALRAEPWRLSVIRAYARHRAFDHRTGDPGAAKDARGLIRSNVARHGWHPFVRLDAADVEMLLGNPEAAARWIDAHLAIFPNDPRALAGAASLALDAGDASGAEHLARRALTLDPELELAKTVLSAVSDKTEARG